MSQRSDWLPAKPGRTTGNGKGLAERCHNKRESLEHPRRRFDRVWRPDTGGGRRVDHGSIKDGKKVPWGRR